MRLAINIFLLFLILTTQVCCVEDFRGTPKVAQQDELTFLGQRFLGSLKNDDPVGFAQCWIPWTVLAHRDKELSDKGLPNNKKAFIIKDRLKRDRSIEIFYNVLRAKLNHMTNGKLEQVTLMSVTGDISQQEGSPMFADDLSVTFRLDAQTVMRVCLDGGFSVGGYWYFADDPGVGDIKIINNGKQQESIWISKLPEWKAAIAAEKIKLATSQLTSGAPDASIVTENIKPQRSPNLIEGRDISTISGGVLWLEERKATLLGNPTITYKFGRNSLRIYHSPNRERLLVYRLKEDGNMQAPGILQARGDGALQGIVDIIDPMGNEVYLSVIPHNENILYSIGDENDMPIVVLRQTDGTLSIGNRSDWLHVIDRKKALIKLDERVSAREVSLKEIESLRKLVIKHFDSKEDKK